jgi:hypothetical protein
LINAFDKAEPKGGGTKSSEGQQRPQEAPAWKAVDFYNLVADSICHQMSQTWSLHSYCILDDDSASTWQGWCIGANWFTYEIPQRHTHAAANPSANGTGILKWWVDATFAVHQNMWGHSEGGLYLRRGYPIMSWPSRNSIPEALWNRKSWALTTSCWQSDGLNTSWKPKDTKFRTMFCSRTTRV